MRTPTPLLQLALAATAALASAPALAIDNAACCVQSTSRLETLLNPSKGSDESFFTSAGGPPNVMFILDTSCSMKAWPEDWPSERGCDHSSFAGAGYDPSVDYEGFISGMTGPAGSKEPTYNTNWFNNSAVYRCDGDSDVFGGGQSFGRDFSNSGGPSGTKWTSGSNLAANRTAACNDIHDTSETDYATKRTNCLTCLQTKGYYVKNSSTRIADGNFLDFYSPRDVSAVMTLSQLLFSIREVRLGIVTFDDWSSTCWSSSQVCMWQPPGPSCDKMYPLDTSAVENNRNSILNSLARNNSFNGGTPLASSLYAVGHYMRSKTPDGYDALFSGTFPTEASFNEPNAINDKSICTGCSFNAVVILTDGQPNSEIHGTLPTEITSLTTVTAPYCPAGTGVCDSRLDEIAAFLWRSDLRQDQIGVQRVATYTIGFATDTEANQLLASTARVGGGKYYAARNAATIKESILTILDDIASRNNSFSSSAVAAVQTGSSSTPALLPRMQPKKNEPWLGRLWRFDQYNEFAENADLNGDSDKEDVFIVEGVANPTSANIVSESAEGNFVKPDGAAATAFWEANDRLVSTLSAGVANRKVWTVFDTDGDSSFTSADTLVRVQFNSSATDDLKLAEYMGLRGSSFCPTSASSTGSLLARFAMSISQAATATGLTLSAPPTTPEYDRLCVRLVVLWLQGADLYDVDADGNRTEVRPNVLGDIFHSSPVVVEPPVDRFLCELGLSNQCARTLFATDLNGLAPTPAATHSVTKAAACGAGTLSLKGYEAWAYEQRARQKVVLVGANDGMIHAFQNGSATETCTGGIPVSTYSAGTGNEAWAFIPPDLLPKIPDMLLTHEYMVDGDLMVRDIWADESPIDGIKQKGEFHTLAIASEGRGGKHYTALEVSFTGGVIDDRPKFRWIFPQPCTEEAASFGRTFYSLSPKPPPVGPVLINASGLPTPLPPSPNLNLAAPVSRNGVNTHERWIVALSGGWSPGLEKGRGVYVVDAWNGEVNGRRDNLWWKFEYNPTAAGFSTPAKYLTHSVPAPVALVDYGANGQPLQDSFFDTAIFGDTAGQLWVARLHAPGSYSSTTKLIDNWSAARAFEMDRDGVAPAATASTTKDGGTEPVDPDGKLYANKAPFYYLPSVGIEPGTNKLRAFAGTGNRYALLESYAGSCRFDNPAACSKSKCSDFKVVSDYEDGVVKMDGVETHWKSRRFEHAKLSETIKRQPDATLVAADTCGSAGSVRVKASNTDFRAGTCDYPTGSDPTPGQVNEIDYECGLDTAGSFRCTRKSFVRNGGLNDLLASTAVDWSGLGNNRFYGLWAYGGARVFVESADGGTTPTTFDTDRLTDRTALAPTSGQLVNVTAVGCDATGACDGGATAADNGWFFDYGTLDRKTATGAAVLASCVLWSDLSPTGGDGGVCGAAATPLSRVYQADFITGQPNCAFGFLPTDGGSYSRFVARTVVAPPPEPASVVQLSSTGEVRYTAMLVEPSQGQATNINVAGGQDVLQMVYELPVSRSLHACRHSALVDGGCSSNP